LFILNWHVEVGRSEFVSSRRGRRVRKANWFCWLPLLAWSRIVQRGDRGAVIDGLRFPPGRPVSWGAIGLCAVLILGPAFRVAGSEVAAGEVPISAARRFVFDIAAQPLVNALDAYSGVTGFETLYDSALAHGRSSSAVHGTFTAAEALRTMLIGTSLSARLISQGAVTIELQQSSVQTVLGPAPDQSEHRRYFGLIQAGLEHAFCRDSQIKPGEYRVVLRFSISANGQIREPSVIGTTGSEDRDRMILRALGGVSLGSAPPANLQQPILMVILPRSTGSILDCTSIQ
jgi:hypothetical protein